MNFIRIIYYVSTRPGFPFWLAGVPVSKKAMLVNFKESTVNCRLQKNGMQIVRNYVEFDKMLFGFILKLHINHIGHLLRPENGNHFSVSVTIIDIEVLKVLSLKIFYSSGLNK